MIHPSEVTGNDRMPENQLINPWFRSAWKPSTSNSWICLDWMLGRSGRSPVLPNSGLFMVMNPMVQSNTTKKQDTKPGNHHWFSLITGPFFLVGCCLMFDLLTSGNLRKNQHHQLDVAK